MTQAAAGTRRFSVCARHVAGDHARLLEEVSFEAAAVAFVEDFHPPLTDAPEITIIVRDVGSGAERCFRIDLETGDAAPCA